MKNKGKQAEDQKKARPQRMPSPTEVFKEIQERIPQLDTRMAEERQKHEAERAQRLERESLERQKQETERAQRLEKESLERQKIAEDRLHALQGQQKQAETRVELIKSVGSSPIYNKISSGVNVSKPAITPSKKQLIDGIIWSEIIGSPRAIKAHKSLKKHK